ncbi:hypothetical protein GGR54DRAFT_604899 [Hypoxylon sp. NC1633]|nr:hypothetical protein GGR54DRAFT_604899 [Hypoxylon sp. NC1633]
MSRPRSRSQVPRDAFHGPLLRRESRWMNLPIDRSTKQEAAHDTYNLLLYLEDVKAERPDRANVERAVTNAQDISFDYRPHGRTKKIRTIRLKGNKPAKDMIAEMDALIQLGRTFYDSPGDLSDWLRSTLEERIQTTLLDEDGSRRVTVRRALEWAERWAEVRYRYLNFYLRDDPVHYRYVNGGIHQAGGNAANSVVHDSNFQADCMILDSKFFDDSSRGFFKYVYGLTVDEARRMVAASKDNDIPTSIRNVLIWAMHYIDRYIKWRENTLRSRNRRYFATPQRIKKPPLREHHLVAEKALWNLTTSYGHFTRALVAFMLTTQASGAFTPWQWSDLANAITDINVEIRNNHLNNVPRWPVSYDFINEYPIEPTEYMTL